MPNFARQLSMKLIYNLLSYFHTYSMAVTIDHLHCSYHSRVVLSIIATM